MVANFVAALRHLAIHCQFGDGLNNHLRDSLIQGIEDKRIQHHLLSERGRDLKKALQIAQAMETADKDAEDKQAAAEPPAVGERKINRVIKSTNKPLINGGRNPKATCYHCGGKHLGKDWALIAMRVARKVTYVAKACRSKPNPRKPPQKRGWSGGAGVFTHTVNDEEEPGEVYTMFNTTTGKIDPMYVTVMVNMKPVRMEVDTGAGVSIISETTYRSTWKKGQAPLIQPTKIKLHTYTGEVVPAAGKLQVEVKHDQEQKNLSLVVTSGKGPSLLEGVWLAQLRLDWKAIFRVEEHDALQEKLKAILDARKEVFENKLGTIRGATAKLHVDPNARPKFCKPQPVPFSVRKKVEDELERLEKDDIIQRKQFSEWAAPIVPVLKGNGSVRICRDYKVTANRAIKCDTHPIPHIEDLFVAMAGGTHFTKLDLKHAYLQLKLDESSRDRLTINTHKGLFEYVRLTFGVSSAPSIFQGTMENLLEGIENIVIYIDDILITGQMEEEHLHILTPPYTRRGIEEVRRDWQ